MTCIQFTYNLYTYIIYIQLIYIHDNLYTYNVYVQIELILKDEYSDMFKEYEYFISKVPQLRDRLIRSTGTS